MDPRSTAPPRKQAALATEQLLSEVLLPLFGEGPAPEACAHVDPALPAFTSFVFDEAESARNMLAQLCQDCPELTRDREAFLEHVRGVLESLAGGEGLSKGARTVAGVGAKAPA